MLFIATFIIVLIIASFVIEHWAAEVEQTATHPLDYEEKPKQYKAKAKAKATWKRPVKLKSYIDYEDYIQSPEWHTSDARLNAIISANMCCTMCGSHTDLQVHHITYENLGKEKAEDLALLCGNCHEHTHDIAGKGAKVYPPLRSPYA